MHSDVRFEERRLDGVMKLPLPGDLGDISSPPLVFAVIAPRHEEFHMND